MPTSYRHRQFGRPAVVSLIVVTALLFVVFFFAVGPRPLMLALLAPVLAIVIVVHYVASSLTVEVSERELSWYFGPGFWRKRIARPDIAAVTRVRLPWWYGIGIKYTPRAWVYLVAPGDGVEVALTNGEAFRIGTDDASGLVAALSKVA